MLRLRSNLARPFAGTFAAPIPTTLLASSRALPMLCLLLFFLLQLFPKGLAAQGLPPDVPAEPSAYVTDLADKLSAEQEAQLNAKLQAFETETTNQIFVLLAPTTGGLDDFTATFAVAEAWKPGQADRDNGLLVALYIQERRIRIEVGYGLEGDVPDAVAKRIIDQTITPQLKQGNFYAALDQGTDRLIEASRGAYDAEGYVPTNGGGSLNLSPWFGEILLYGAFAVFLFSSALRGLRAEDTWRFPLRDVENEDDFAKLKPEASIGKILENWIVQAIVVGIGVALVWGGLAFALAFIAFLFVDELYGLLEFLVLSIPGAVALIGSLVLVLRRMWRDAPRTRRRIREMLENENRWAELERSYEPGDVRFHRAKYRRALQALTPGWLVPKPLAELESSVNAALQDPEQVFALRPDVMLERIQFRVEDAKWEGEFAERFDPAFVREVRAEFQRRLDKLQGAGYSSRKAVSLKNELNGVLSNPEHHLEFTLEDAVAEIRKFADNEKLWNNWRENQDFARKKVDTHRQMVREKLTHFERVLSENPRGKTRAEKQTETNEFLRKHVRLVQQNPRSYFKRPEPRITSTSSSSRSSSSSSWSSSSSSSWGGSSSSSWSSSSSSSISFGGGGGGSFGGGGASGGW